MFQIVFVTAVILVVPAFFAFTWLMSRHYRKKTSKHEPAAPRGERTTGPQPAISKESL
jgi:hypothetical protein